MEPNCNVIHRDSENDSQLVLGLDAGTVRCGVARADASLTLASPLGVVQTNPLAELAGRIAALLEGQSARLLVAGLPLDQNGNEGPSCAMAREVAAAVGQGLACPVEYIHHRLRRAQPQFQRQGRARRKGH
jgi:putative Holliday junction resolvase